MKYQANPVIVDAYVIADIAQSETEFLIHFDDGRKLALTRKAWEEATSRFVPGEGDYYVVQDDGYWYFNPKAVFERKYAPKVEAA